MVFEPIEMVVYAIVLLEGGCSVVEPLRGGAAGVRAALKRPEYRVGNELINGQVAARAVDLEVNP